LQRLTLLLGLTQEKPVVEAFDLWLKKDQPTQQNKQEPAPVVTPPASVMPEEVKRERSLVGMLLVRPDLLEYAQFRVEEKDFTHPSYKRLYIAVMSWYNKDTNKSPTNLITSVQSTLPPTAHEPFQKLLFDTQTAINDLEPEQILQEYISLVQALRQRQREDRIQSFAERIASAEASKDRTKVLELMQQMQSALKQKEFHAKEDS
jgi:replicative DNA helicase